MAWDNPVLGAVRRTGRRGIQTLPQFLAGPKEWHALFFDRHRRPRAGIAPLTRRPHLDRERAEAPQLDAVSGRQGARDFVKHGGYDALDIAVVQMRVALSKARHQFRLDHSPCPPDGK